jgi:hypothetical protein
MAHRRTGRTKIIEASLYREKKAWPRSDGPTRSTEKNHGPDTARHVTKYFTARYIGPGLGRGHGPWAGTSTTRLKQARNGSYRGTKRPIYLLKSHLIPHFHVLDKEHKAIDNVS